MLVRGCCSNRRRCSACVALPSSQCNRRFVCRSRGRGPWLNFKRQVLLYTSYSDLPIMKFIVFSVIAISVLSLAVAVTQTYYTDAACATPAVGTTENPNPQVTALNACMKLGATSSVKPTACGNGAGSYSRFVTADCTGVAVPFPFVTDKCLPTGISGSSKYTCDSASSVALASVAVAAAVLAFCM